MNSRTGWDRMIATKTYGLVDPDSHVLNKLSLFKKSGLNKVLDLGCGQGRHTLLLAREDFKAFALDISPAAVKTTKDTLGKEGLSAEVRLGDMRKTGYSDNFFDAVLAWRALYLGKINEVKKSFSEVKRILRPGGIIYASIRSTNNTLFHLGKHKGKEIEPNTFCLDCDGLSGIIYHFFTQDEVAGHFAGFEILGMEELELQHTEYTARYPEHKNLFWLILAKKPESS
ncbi:MAG: class I SAM-dependent methyltransferase [Candidatus Omnitrophota bacterium]